MFEIMILLIFYVPVSKAAKERKYNYQVNNDM